MTPLAALTAFLLAAALLTVTPGLDTMLVLRTTAGEGRRAALLAALGIQLGCLAWGTVVAIGLGTLLAASRTAYAALTLVGAVYLAWMGLTLLLRPRHTLAGAGAARRSDNDESGSSWLWRGLLTNILNPKIGIFYVSFLPQFVPAGWPPAPVVFALAVLHVGLASAWLSLIVFGIGRLRGLLQRGPVVAWLDRVTGIVFITFGLRLALRRSA